MSRKDFSNLALIIIIFIAACIETDSYLPAFPDMMIFFNTSEEAIQGLLTWNFFGICISCPFYGPLSDAYGRRLPLLVALSLFFLGSLITLFVTDLNLMLMGRVLQGIGSGGCFTLGTAILFDAFPKEKAMLAINQLNTIIPIIMATAPMLGAHLNNQYGFKSNFLAITMFVGFSLFICLVFYRETLKSDQRKDFSFLSLIKDFKRAFTCVPFWQTSIYISLFFALYIGFLSLISVFFVLELKVDKLFFPWFQTAILGSFVLASLSYKRVFKRLGKDFKKTGLGFSFLGAILFCLSALLFPKNPYAMTACMMIVAVGLNFTMTLYFDECIHWLEDIKGIAASLLTSARLLLTAIFVGISGKIYDKTVIPFALLTTVVVLICGICIISYEKNYAKKMQKILHH
ncbi:MAG: MFS transporter [Myxococcales bacterium]|nr:MFS transporter [Myxococcales bacterium]